MGSCSEVLLVLYDVTVTMLESTFKQENFVHIGIPNYSSGNHASLYANVSLLSGKQMAPLITSMNRRVK